MELKASDDQKCTVKQLSGQQMVGLMNLTFKVLQTTEPGKSLNLNLEMSRPEKYWKRLWPWETPE